MRLSKPTVAAIAFFYLAAVLSIGHAVAQQRLVFKVGVEHSKYTQQHRIDVGDSPGHQVRAFEIHRTYPSDAPLMNGMRIVESWTRGISDYTSNNGEGTTYGVYVLENGDKFFTRGSLIAVQIPGVRNLTAISVGPVTGGTGTLTRIKGMARISAMANPEEGMVETQIDIEYWLPQ
jgi:hypothetical protein